MRVLPPGALPEFEEGTLVDASFDLIERVADELLRRRPAVARALARSAGSAEVDRYLCRWLLRDVGNFFALVMLVASAELAGYDCVEIERRWPQGPDYALFAEILAGSGLELEPALAAALERLTFAAAPRSLRARLTTAARAVVQLGGLWAEWLGRLRLVPRPLPERPLLLRTYDQDWGLDIGGNSRLRNLDFIVDGETIRPDHLAVWAEASVPAARDAALEARGYGVFRNSTLTIGLATFLVRVLPALVRASLLFARLSRAERWWQEPVRVLATQSIRWSEFARRVRPRVMLAVNDLIPAGIPRTFALRKAGCLTVEYEFSSHWLTDEHRWIPDYVYGFGVVDVMVSWGRLHSEHFRNHRGSIGQFWEDGCLWSEHARLVRDDPEVADHYRRALGVSLADWRHVVGVFDTSTASFFGYDDMTAFYAGIATLAPRFPDALFVCKPKRPVAEVFAIGAGGREVEDALTAAPNVVFVDELFEPAVAVGLCDLSINACFTSPAVETIGAGRPAVYYDPTDLFPRSFFRGIPNLVATSADELEALVRSQLDLDDAARAADLRSRFDELEGHFDGLAITRLRERLRAIIDG